MKEHISAYIISTLPYYHIKKRVERMLEERYGSAE
jgi:hypothetical protein